MLKTLLLASLVLLALTLACSSMSLEDYAEECGEWQDDYGNIASDSLDDAEEALEYWNDLDPPGEVKSLHETREEALRLLLDIARESEELEDKLDDLRDELDDAPRSQREDVRDEMDDLRDEFEDRLEDLWDEMEDLGEDYEDEEDDLPRRVRRELQSEDCI